MLARYATAIAAITIEVVRRTSPHSFQVLRRRWVVERTFGWLMRWRRLVPDYERRPASHEAMVYWATVFIMTSGSPATRTASRPSNAGEATASHRARKHRLPHNPFINRL